MKRLWITYSWDDDKQGDVRFIAQELEKMGIEVKIDKWDLHTGKRLWEQIEKFITDTGETDGWAIVATQNSLGSEACKEELAYALDRALKTRGGTFPLIGIFPSTIDDSLIPAAIKTRLYVSTAYDENWKERIVSSLEGRKPNISKDEIDPFEVFLHNFSEVGRGYVIEMRPRAGTWAPFLCAIPFNEKEKVSPRIFRAARGKVPMAYAIMGVMEGVSDDNNWWFLSCQEEATPTMSYFLQCEKLPSEVIFGDFESKTKFFFRP